MNNEDFIWTDELVLELIKQQGFFPTWEEGKTMFEKFKKTNQLNYPNGIISFKDGDIIQKYQPDDIRLTYNQFCSKGIEKGHEIWQVQNTDEALTVGDEVTCGQKRSTRIGSFSLIHQNKVISVALNPFGSYLLPNPIIKRAKATNITELKEKILNLFEEFEKKESGNP